MGIYRHISAGLLRFIQGAHTDWRGMRLVQYGTPAQGRRRPHLSSTREDFPETAPSSDFRELNLNFNKFKLKEKY